MSRQARLRRPVLNWIRVDGFGGDERCPPKRDAWRVEMESTTSGVLLPASFARPLSIFRVCEGSIPNPPNIPAAHRSGPLKGPLEQVPPRSRVHTSLERVPPHSRVHAPLERAPPRSRVHLRLARSSPTRTPVPARGYGHLMLWHGRAALSCAWESHPGPVAPTP
jgi:hypothetical protein